MINYETLQDQVVSRLQPFITVGISVERLPENEAEKKKTLPTKARFTVIYAGSEYDKTRSTSNVVQDENIFVQVFIESTFLYGVMGVYNLANILKTALIGFQPTGCRKMQVSKHHTIGQPDAEKKNNMWQYQVIFQTTGVQIEDFTEDISILLKKLTFIDQDGETMVVPPVE